MEIEKIKPPRCSECGEEILNLKESFSGVFHHRHTIQIWKKQSSGTVDMHIDCLKSFLRELLGVL